VLEEVFLLYKQTLTEIARNDALIVQSADQFEAVQQEIENLSAKQPGDPNIAAMYAEVLIYQAELQDVGQKRRAMLENLQAHELFPVLQMMDAKNMLLLTLGPVIERARQEELVADAVLAKSQEFLENSSVFCIPRDIDKAQVYAQSLSKEEIQNALRFIPQEASILDEQLRALMVV
jgi:hypothetical protein